MAIIAYLLPWLTKPRHNESWRLQWQKADTEGWGDEWVWGSWCETHSQKTNDHSNKTSESTKSCSVYLEVTWKNWVSHLLVGMKTDTAGTGKLPPGTSSCTWVFFLGEKSLYMTQSLYTDVLRLAVIGKDWKLPSFLSTYIPCMVGGLFSALLTVYLCSSRRRMMSEMATVPASQQLLSKLWCISNKKKWAVGPWLQPR